MLSINLPNVNYQLPSVPLSTMRKRSTTLECSSTRAPSSVPATAQELRREVMPKHIAVIMDGNGRWARSRGLQVEDGHNAGVVALTKLIINCCEFGIKALTTFAFSTENWTRTEVEVDFLMRIIESFIRLEVMDLIKRYNIRFSVIGEVSRLPKPMQSAISSAQDCSHDNKGLHFIMALNYGGRCEISEACKKIAAEVKDGVLRVDDIDEKLVDQQMQTNITAFSDPDLMIRTSGELRVSNFLLWQLAYAEFYFFSKLFPDYLRADLVEALTSFQSRKRRFGDRPN